jgi:hypothetical protein
VAACLCRYFHSLTISIGGEYSLQNSVYRFNGYFNNMYASFETFMAVTFQVKVFWVVTACSVVAGYQYFRGLCCLHLQGEVKMEAAWASEMLVSYNTS